MVSSDGWLLSLRLVDVSANASVLASAIGLLLEEKERQAEGREKGRSSETIGGGSV